MDNIKRGENLIASPQLHYLSIMYIIFVNQCIVFLRFIDNIIYACVHDVFFGIFGPIIIQHNKMYATISLSVLKMAVLYQKHG